jgi:hypothetical protein
MKEKRDEEEAGKKTSAARAKVLARDDVQGAMQSQAAHQAAQAAAKNKPLERLTPEQSLAKGQAEKRQRDAVERERVSALPSTAMSQLMAERKPEDSGLMAALNKQNTINDWLGTSGPDLRPEQYPAQYDRDAEPAAPAKPAAPAAPAGRLDDRDPSFSTMSGRGGSNWETYDETGKFHTDSPAAMLPFIRNPNYKPGPNDPDTSTDANGNPKYVDAANSATFRKQVEEEMMNPSGRARPVAKPAEPIAGRMSQAVAEENMSPQDRQAVQGQRRAYQTAALPYSFPVGLANYYGGEGGKQLMSDTLGAVSGVPGAISDAFGAVGRGARAAKDTVDAGVGAGAGAIADMFGEYTPGPGGQKMLDQAAEFLEPRVSPTIDAGVQYAKDRIAEVGPGTQRLADRAAEFLEPRVSPTIDSATRYGQQKFSDLMTAVDRPLAEGGLRFDPGVRMPPQREVGGATGGSIGAPTAPREGLNPTSFESFLDSLLPPAHPDSMNSAESNMKANDAWRAEMARAEAEANFVGPPAPAPKGKVKVKQRR